MASLAARTPQKVSRSWSSVVARLWRTARGSSSSSVLQYRSYCDEGLNGRVSPSPEASPAANLLVNTPLSREFPPAVSKIGTFGADRPVNDRHAYRARRYERFRVYQTVNANLKGQLTRTALNENESPVCHFLRASSNVAQEPCHETPRQGFICGKELPIGSACRGDIHMPSVSTKSKEAIAILTHRQPSMLIEILKRCSKQKDLISARQVHKSIIQSGIDTHPYVATTLLNVYIKCGRLQDARLVFDGLEKTDRNVITWTLMIGAYAKSGCGVEAYQLFLQMKREGFEPDAITYLSILNTAASADALEWVKEVHGHARRAGLESDLCVGSALVHMFAKSGSIGDARIVFDRLKTRDVTTWTTMIGAYSQSGCGVEAYRLFLQMNREGFIPDAITYMSILNASASAGAFEWVKEVHSHTLKPGLEMP